MSNIGSIGVDLGGNTAVIAATTKNGVVVLDNEASHRETPVIVGFGENERFLGEQGAAQLKSNFKNTIVFPTRFLGLDAQSPFLQEEKKWLYSPLVTLADNKIAFEVTSGGETKTFLPEQVVAMMLQNIKLTTKKSGLSANDIVLSVPSYYTENEKKALLDAAKIAQINVTKLMNECSATALSYGIFRKSELTNKPRNVAFIDVGHCSTSAYVASFTNEKMTMRNQISERNLGVRDLDWKVLEFYNDMIKSQYGADIMNKDKLRLRILDAIAKQRKILSANSDATINVDYVTEDNDLGHTLTREKFEEIIASVVERFNQVFLRLKKELNGPLDSIEIVGGGTRIPIIQKLIQDVFGLEVSRTLNASECIARGCATQAAMLSPIFKVTPYLMEEISEYPIKCSWQFKNPSAMETEYDSSADLESQTTVLFPKGCCIPNAKALNFQKEGNFEIKLYYDETVPVTNKVLAVYKIQGKKPSVPEYSAKIRLALNHNGMVEIDGASLVEEFYDDNLTPGGAPKNFKSNRPMQQEEEVQKKKRTRNIALDVVQSDFNSMSEAEIAPLIDLETKMSLADQVIADTYEKKNELESYVYDVRNKLSDKYEKYILQQDKDKINEDLTTIESWLYGEGFKASKGDYQSRLDQLKGKMSNIEKRFTEYELIKENVEEFSRVLSKYNTIAVSREPHYAYIGAQDRRIMLESIQANRDWLQQIEKSLESSSRMQNPPVSSQQIADNMQKFTNNFSPLIAQGQAKSRSAEKTQNNNTQGSSKPTVTTPPSSGKTKKTMPQTRQQQQRQPAPEQDFEQEDLKMNNAHQMPSGRASIDPRLTQQRGGMHAPQDTRMEEEYENTQHPSFFRREEPSFYDRPGRQSLYTPQMTSMRDEYDGYPNYGQSQRQADPRTSQRHRQIPQPQRQQPRNNGFFGGLNDYFGFPGYSWR